MVLRSAEPLSTLYEEDETAWLEATAELIRQGRHWLIWDIDMLDTDDRLKDNLERFLKKYPDAKKIPLK